MEQFSNMDAPKKPQKVHIRWELATPTDDSVDSPEERDEGFWPSKNKDAPGYVGECSDEEFDRQYQEARDRMDRFNAGDWEYVGVIALAHLMLPIGGGSFRLMTMQSAGLWGVESDCTDYIAEIFEEQKADLLGELKTLGEALASGDFIQEDA